MPIIRADKKENFTVMTNDHLQDDRLSLKAKGLMGYCLMLPDNWIFSIPGLAKKLKEGKGSIASALHELEKAGYLKRRQIRDSQGRIVEVEYTFIERPDRPNPENSDTVNPDTGFPMPDNPAELNTNGQSTDPANTDASITNPIRSDREVGRARKAPARQRVSDDWRATKEEVEEQICYANLIDEYPLRKGEIDELVMTMLEALTSRKPTLRVNSEDRPAAMVKERLKMLHYDHMKYVLDNLLNTSSKIRKPDHYLLTALYNAPSTINNHYSLDANNDMYGSD